MKLIFASPTYGPVEPAAIVSQRAAIMHAGGHGVVWVGDASPDKQTFTVARGQVAAAACASDADAVFWADSDIVLPVDAISRLASLSMDFVTGIYFQKAGEHWPLIANFADDHYNWMVRWPENVVAPVDGCGFGCVLTSTKMLRIMREAYQPDLAAPKLICDLCETRQLHAECHKRPMTDNEIREKANPWFEYSKFSEDFEFCQRAKKAGFQLHVDTAVLCGHLPPPPAITMEHFKVKHPEFFGGKDNGHIASKQISETGLRKGTEGSGNGYVPEAALELG
jgi:hypothetical protein